jgi:hypothetical protein
MFSWDGRQFDLPEAVRYRVHGLLDAIDPTPERPQPWTALDVALIVAAFVLIVVVGLVAR